MNGLEILKWLKNCWGWDTRDREQAYRAWWLRIDLLKIETGWGAAIGDVQSCIFHLFLIVIQQKTDFFKINFYWTIVALQCCVVSGAQQSESAIHISPLFGFPSFRSLQNTEWGSLCYTVGSLYLPIFIHSIDSVDTSIPSPIHPTPPSFLGIHMFVREILYLCLVHLYIIETKFHETILTLPVGKSL